MRRSAQDDDFVGIQRSSNDDFVGILTKVERFVEGTTVDKISWTSIVEFDSYDIAHAAQESVTHRKALQALGSGAERDFRIIEGA